MGSIIKKKRKYNTYYYYVESKRVDGKPRIVNQVYLGTADAVLNKYKETEEKIKPLYSVVLDFADVAVLYDLAMRLDIVGIINKHTKKRKQGTSVGEYALIASINRALSPTSKSCISNWYSKTILPKLLPVKENALTPQNFWNHMRISDEALNSINNEMVKKIIDTYDVDTTHLIYDATNFYTYIDTMQESELAKRGHCKHKRNDLKIVGLSMMITPDCNIPLLYDTYPGNRPDSKQFAFMLEKLKSQYEMLTNKKADITTIIFDRGNNSEYNIDSLEDEAFPLYYVGGLKRNQCVDLYAVSKDFFTPLSGDGFKSACAFRTMRKVYNRDMTIVVVFNKNLYDGQMQGIEINIEKTTDKLADLQKRLKNRVEGLTTKGRAPTVASVEKQLKTILSAEFMDDIFSYEMSTLEGLPHFNYKFCVENFSHLQDTILGKVVHFTNRHDWTNEEIAASYRSAWHIEHSFRQMKDNDHLTVRPLFHWTDEKIKVHIFYCILAYRMCCLLKKELLAKGIDDSLNQLLNQLCDIKYVKTVLDTSQSDTLRSFSQGTALAEKIISLYDLKNKYFPNII